MAVDYRELVRSTAAAAGGDPALALAVGVEESNLNPKAVGDQGRSVGIFQENDQGAGAGLTLAQREDPIASTQRFVQRVKDLLASGFQGSPGDIAAAVQRPAYPGHYADAVNKLYAQEVQTLGGTSSSSNGSPGPNDVPQGPPASDRGRRPGVTGGVHPPIEGLPTIGDQITAPVKNALSQLGQDLSAVGTGILVAGVIVTIGLIGLIAMVKGD